MKIVDVPKVPTGEFIRKFLDERPDEIFRSAELGELLNLPESKAGKPECIRKILGRAYHFSHPQDRSVWFGCPQALDDYKKAIGYEG